MNKILKTSLALAAGAVLMQSAALADTPASVPPRGPIPFAALDVDSDGKVTADECAKAHQQRWAQRAAQGCPMRGMGRHGAAVNRMDRDGDGAVGAEAPGGFRGNCPIGGTGCRQGRTL